MAEIEIFRARNTTGLAINNIRVTRTKPYGLIQTMQKYVVDDKAIIEAIGADVQSNQWISVNDKMPEDGQPVLYVYNINPDLKVVMYGWHETIKGLGSGWHQAGVGGARCEEDVSHWQPLPEPPKEE